MKIHSLNFLNFRNLHDKKIIFGENINLFYGKNAQGKTSLLEAIYFGSMGISFRTKKVVEMMKYNKSKFGTHLEFENELGANSLTVKYGINQSHQKTFLMNGKKKAHSDFFGQINIIVYVPEDIIIINGSPKNRRNFFDIEISQSDRLYFSNLKTFNKLLKIRNKFLKEKNINNAEYKIYTENFVEYAAKIMYSRMQYVKEMNCILCKLYNELFEKQQELKIVYKSIENIDKLEVQEIKNAIYKNIADNINTELKYGYSLVGPQKDDYTFLLDDKDANVSASQGEKKSIIFSLKLAELEMVKKNKREYPVVLIDDITSYFDKYRRKSVIEFLKKKRIQVIISSTDKIEEDCFSFFVDGGDILSEQ